MTNKNPNITTLDLAQMQKRTFDDSIDAQRVVIVGQEFNIDNDKLANALKESIASIKLEQPSIASGYINTEIRTIEIPHIITEPKIIEIEKPVITTEIKIVEIPKIVEVPVIQRMEVPVIVKEVQVVEVERKSNKFEKAYLILNLILLAILIAKNK